MQQNGCNSAARSSGNEATVASAGTGGETFTLMLPWPPASLSPNTRQHYMALARARKRYRHDCWLSARAQGVRRIHAERVHVSIRFAPPTRRHYDMDNLLSRLKSGLDGLADVLGVDDSRWSLRIEMAEPVKGGSVYVEVS